jgi:hypothetical protein
VCSRCKHAPVPFHRILHSKLLALGKASVDDDKAKEVVQKMKEDISAASSAIDDLEESGKIDLDKFASDLAKIQSREPFLESLEQATTDTEKQLATEVRESMKALRMFHSGLVSSLGSLSSIVEEKFDVEDETPACFKLQGAADNFDWYYALMAQGHDPRWFLCFGEELRIDLDSFQLRYQIHFLDGRRRCFPHAQHAACSMQQNAA